MQPTEVADTVFRALRGPGYFGIDTGLAKQCSITEQQKLTFSWEVFNVTNSVRFDAANSSNAFDLSSPGFGVHSSTLTSPASCNSPCGTVSKDLLEASDRRLPASLSASKRRYTK